MISRLISKQIKGFYQLSNKNINLGQFNRLYNTSRYTFIDQKLFNQDHYKILGVQPNSSKDDIKKQYYKLTKLYHPDINKGNEEKFKQINSAWDVLSDDTKRKEYDQYNGLFGHSQNSSSQSQGFNNAGAQGFNPFQGFGAGNFGQNPFQSGQGQNPFGPGSPFEQVDLDQLLKNLKEKGIKLEDIQSNPHFNEFNQIFGMNEEPKTMKDKIKHKVKQEALKLMLRKLQTKLEKDLEFHKQQKERYQNQQNQSYQATSSSSNRQTYQQQNNNQQSYSQNNQSNNNQFEFDPFKGFRKQNQTYYTNKPTGSNNQQATNTQGGNVQDTINKASDMFSKFFKK